MGLSRIQFGSAISLDLAPAGRDVYSLSTRAVHESLESNERKATYHCGRQRLFVERW